MSATRRSQRGASLITAVFLITAMAIIAAVVSRLSATTAHTSAGEVLSARALYAAESGIDWAAYQVESGAANCGPTGSGDRGVGDGSWFDATISCVADLGPGQPKVYRFVVTGKAGGNASAPLAQRRLDVQYMP